jgi:hypothetical protein
MLQAEQEDLGKRRPVIGSIREIGWAHRTRNEDVLLFKAVQKALTGEEG